MKCQIVSVRFFFLKIATFRIGVELCSLLNIMSRNRKSQTMKIHCVTLTTKIFSEHKASVLFVLTVVEMSTTFFSPPFFNENSEEKKIDRNQNTKFLSFGKCNISIEIFFIQCTFIFKRHKDSFLLLMCSHSIGNISEMVAMFLIDKMSMNEATISEV